MKKLTVLVSLYNSGQWIENRIENLLQSSIIDDMEIWCVNAHSPDDRDHDIPNKFPVHYVRLPKRITVYETWNYIIENSNSTYLTNANTDDLVHPKCYEKLIGILDKESNYGFAYPSWYCTKIANQQWSSLNRVDPGGKPGNYAGNINIAGVGHFPLWRRSLHDQFGLFDTNFRVLADADWWARCYWIGKVKFKWVNELLACYLWRKGENLWHKEITTEEWKRFNAKVSKYKSDGE